MAVTPKPAGSWPSPITSELLVSDAVRLSAAHSTGRGELVWAEGRPGEGGRTQLVLLRDGRRTDLLPDGFNARTAVHEYGGGAWWVRDDTVWFTNWADQRLYRFRWDDPAPEPLTRDPAVARGERYADGDVSPDGGTIVCVRETHPENGAPATDVRNEIVQLAAHTPTAEPTVLVSGPDFVAAPRFAPDGRTVSYLRWNHPSMPWDTTELIIRNLATGAEETVAGGVDESICEPSWGPDGNLYFVSDRTGWWNLYRHTGTTVEAESDARLASIAPVAVLDAEIALPDWTLGTQRYAVLPDGQVIFAATRDGYDRLAVSSNGVITELDLPFSWYGCVQPDTPDSAIVIAGSPTAELEITRVRLDGGTETLRAPRELGLDPGYISVPEHVSFPSTAPDGSAWTAHALYYPPASAEYELPDGERPPLLVVIHGGPTAAAVPLFAPSVQYWTSRGFAVVDVNYGGSTGYGRAYRERLLGNWGLVDVTDCLAAARWLADQGKADPLRLCIRGGSAGGFTTLAALARKDTPFAAGADHFGVSDLQVLAADTHKFESRYLDRIVGPYPEAKQVYIDRSPITHVDQLTRPLIVLQGDEDAVVPPSQSELIVDALRERGVPVAYLLFEGEQHGFRRAENIRRATDAELSFYATVLGFDLPDDTIEDVPIENLPRAR
jgi:dipeptidyl aminopeptidase/acylaminoacyl peptidase